VSADGGDLGDAPDDGGKTTAARPTLAAPPAPPAAPAKVPQPHGGALNAGGVRGHRGGSGRKPDEFKAMCARLASREATARRVRAILDDADHQHFMRALQWATENGYGPPAQRHEHTGTNGAPIPHEIIVTRRLVRPEGDGA